MQGNGVDAPPAPSSSSADPGLRRPLFPASPLSSSLGTPCFPLSSSLPSGPCAPPPPQPAGPGAWPGIPFSFLPLAPSPPSAPMSGHRASSPLQPLWSDGPDGCPRGLVSSSLPCSSPIYFPPPLICPPSVAPLLGANPPRQLSPLIPPEARGGDALGAGERSREEETPAAGSARAEARRPPDADPAAVVQSADGPSQGGGRQRPEDGAASPPEGPQQSGDAAPTSKDTIRFVPLDQVFPSPEDQASYAAAMASVYAGQLDVWYWYSRQLSMQLDLLRFSSAASSAQPLSFLAGMSPDGNDVLLSPNGLLADGFASTLSSPLASHGGPLRPEETPVPPPSPIDANTGSRLGGVGAVFRLCGLEFCFGRNPGAQGAGANPLGLHNPPDTLGYTGGDNFRSAASAASGQEGHASGAGAPTASSGPPSRRTGTEGEAEQEAQGEAGGRVNAWDQYNIGVFVKLLLLLFLFDAGREVYIVTLLFLLMHVNGFFDPLILWMRQNSHTQPLEVTLARLRHRRERRPLQELQRQQRELRTSTDLRRQERGSASADEPGSSEVQSATSGSVASEDSSSSVSSAPATSEADVRTPDLRRRVASSEVESDREERRERSERQERRERSDGQERGGVEQEDGREREVFCRPTYLQRVLYQGVVMFFLTFLPWWNPDPVYLVQDDEDEVGWPVDQAQGAEDDAFFAERMDDE